MSLTSLSWQEQTFPLINNQGDLEYWDNYIDKDPWTDDIPDMIELEYVFKVLLDRFLEKGSYDLKTEAKMKTNFYSKVLPLAISYLKVKGKLNVGVLEAMMTQNM